MNKTLNALSFQIETNRQRLQHAMDADKPDLAQRTLLLLTHLHAAFYDEVKKGLTMERAQKQLIVFSEAYQDGKLMTLQEYHELRRTMSRCDLATHATAEVDADLVDEVAAVIQDETKKSA